MENKFADRIGNIMVSNGIARLDFLTLKEIHKDTHQADFELAFRLNIPVDGIMQAVDTLEKMKADLLIQQAHAATTATAKNVPAEQVTLNKEQPKKPKKRLTRKEFEKLPPEEQAKIRQRAKLKEQARIKKQLEQ